MIFVSHGYCIGANVRCGTRWFLFAGMLYGEADPLDSSYHISYNMLLNMLRVEDVDPEFLVKSSFHQYQQESSAPALEVSHFSVNCWTLVVERQV